MMKICVFVYRARRIILTVVQFRSQHKGIGEILRDAMVPSIYEMYIHCAGWICSLHSVFLDRFYSVV